MMRRMLELLWCCKARLMRQLKDLHGAAELKLDVIRVISALGSSSGYKLVSLVNYIRWIKWKQQQQNVGKGQRIVLWGLHSRGNMECGVVLVINIIPCNVIYIHFLNGSAARENLCIIIDHCKFWKSSVLLKLFV